MADDTGAPVAGVESLTLRPVDARRLAADADAAPAAALHGGVGPRPPPGRRRSDWAEAADGLDAATGSAIVVVRPPGAPDTAEGAHQPVRDALEVVQRWLADERFAEGRLAFVTRGAVAALPGDDVTGLAAAPVWGLIRSVQSEHPDRVVLVDLDGDDDRLLPAALAAGNPSSPSAAASCTPHGWPAATPRPDGTHRPRPWTAPSSSPAAPAGSARSSPGTSSPSTACATCCSAAAAAPARRAPTRCGRN
ncbi:SpnB-like Rossmann fold domain-containing protein [Streptomyces lividans]